MLDTILLVSYPFLVGGAIGIFAFVMYLRERRSKE